MPELFTNPERVFHALAIAGTQDLSRIYDPPPPRTEADEDADEKSCQGRSEEFVSWQLVQVNPRENAES